MSDSCFSPRRNLENILHSWYICGRVSQNLSAIGSWGQPLEGNMIPQTAKDSIPSELLKPKPALLLNKITFATCVCHE